MADETNRNRDGRSSNHDGDKGQYGGLKRGLGYGGGRDIKDAERPAKDIDFDDDVAERGER